MGQKTALYNTTSEQIQGFYDSVDSPVPATLLAGTSSIDISDVEWQEALSNPGKCTVVNGVWTVAAVWPPALTLAQVQQSQSALIQAAAIAAETAPLTFTTSAGTSATFLMDATSWTKYLGAYTHYVVHVQTLPAGFSFFSSSGVAVSFTVADIAAFFTAGLAQIEASMTKQATLLGQIASASTVTAVESVVW